ncbi:MAG: L,D-transpeptidase family protein [Coxiellaceae bacterium]|nr:L,D-transpeptidase family protein [Coxiellaceae bacterium]
MRIILIITTLLSLLIAKSAFALEHVTQEQLALFSQYARQHLVAAFRHAGVAYPPKHLALLIFKQSRRMQMYARDDDHWHFVKTFQIKAASGGPGPKLQEGDYQVPEGIYRVTGLNPYSRFTLSMKLNYPNRFDRQEAQLTHRSHLGNNIFIHGKAQSVGCIAIGDAAIEQLYPLVAATGRGNVRVIIAPDDLRYRQPIYGRVRPRWLPELYRRIRLALSDFPLQSAL